MLSWSSRMKYTPKRAVRVTVKAVSAAIDPLFGPLSGPQILIYHQVGANLGREMEVSTATFIKQIEWLQANGEIVDLPTAVASRGEDGASRNFVLTFDDGFRDVYVNAFPIMRELCIPFTLYLTTRPIETGEPIDRRYPDAEPLTWEQVNEMVETGLVTIGAHTHTHPDLREVVADEIQGELDTSNQIILERTGVAPAHFTYPWGRWSEVADPLVRERYQSSTVGGSTRVSSSDGPHRRARLPVQRSDGFRFFVRRMKYGFRLEEQIRTVRSTL